MATPLQMSDYSGSSTGDSDTDNNGDNYLLAYEKAVMKRREENRRLLEEKGIILKVNMYNIKIASYVLLLYICRN